MKYYEQNGLKIIECEPSEFSIVLYDTTKKSITASTYVNANFFAAGQKYNGYIFTLPVNHLICDYKVTNAGADQMNRQRGKLTNGKYYYDSYSYGAPGDQFYHKELTVFQIKNNIPSIINMTTLDYTPSYLVAGIPIMQNGCDVKWSSYVRPQGWTGGELYGTYHVFIGLKQNSNTIYIIDWKTSTSNCIYSAEAYKKFKAFGLYNVIKLDGGGSEIMKYNGKLIHATSENRRISAAIVVNGPAAQQKLNTASTTTPATSSTNPYTVPTRVLKRGMKGTDVKWLQFQLIQKGFACGGIDGSFGTGTYTALKSYQKAKGLEIDGICGPATRASLKQ